jgi:hypothetical protein
VSPVARFDSSLMSVQSLQLIGHLEVLGESAGLPLRVDQAAVDLDVELARLAGDELGGDAGDFFDGGRETRSLRLVVSGVAVANDDVHEAELTIDVEDAPARERAHVEASGSSERI